MPSSINPYNINGNYPIAGQDNDSQGFRDNFTNTRNNLVFTKSEIEDLQNKVLLKRPLSGGSVNDPTYNDLAGTTLSSAQLKAWYQRAVPHDPAGESVTVDFTAGNFHRIKTSETELTLTFSGFPVGTNAGWGTVCLLIEVTQAGHAVKFPPTVVRGINKVEGYDGTDTIVFSSVGDYLIEISSYNGSVFYIADLSRNAITAPVSREPVGSSPGTIAFADGNGTNGWDPAGTDAGVPYPVYYDGSDWVTFGGAGGAGGATTINSLTNVNITSVSDGDMLTYNTATSKWVNTSVASKLDDLGSLAYPLVEYSVTVADNGSGTQDVFYFDGTALKDSDGNVFDLVLNSNTRYRFDISDSSNGAFKFSTTPDTTVPDTVTDYTNGVTVVGTPGASGAYVEIVITDDTPSPLYFWTPDLTSPSRDGTLIGAAQPIHINGRTRPSQEIDNGDSIDLGMGAAYFTTSGAETATLANGRDGQTIVLAAVDVAAGDMVVTVADAAWGGAGTITFNGQGQTANLTYINGKWFCIGAGPSVNGNQASFD